MMSTIVPMVVLFSWTQINKVTWRDVTWRDVTQHVLQGVPLLNKLDTVRLYGLHVVDLTAAQQNFYLKEK